MKRKLPIRKNIRLENYDYSDGGRPMTAPTVSQIVNQLKGAVTKAVGCSVWQKSFYDHIIRNKDDYVKIWNYIDNNPQKWTMDKYYCEW